MQNPLDENNKVTMRVLDIPNFASTKSLNGMDNLNVIFNALANSDSNVPYESFCIKALIEVRW